MQGIGGRIRSLRKEHRWTQAELARRSGVKEDVVSKHERGALGVGSDSLFGYAKAFGITLEQLTRGLDVIKAPRADRLHAVVPAADEQSIPVQLAKLLSDGRCNPVSDEEMQHMARWISEGNPSDLTSLEKHLLGYRAEKDESEESLAKFREAVRRSRKARGQGVLEPTTQIVPATDKQKAARRTPHPVS
jgi:transcriptional regulator with XRE-family HTH domain